MSASRIRRLDWKISASHSISTNGAAEVFVERCSTWHPRFSRHIRTTTVSIFGRWALSSTVRSAFELVFTRCSSSRAECLFGRTPFPCSSVDELIEEIKSPVPIEVRELSIGRCPWTRSARTRSLPMLESRVNAAIFSSAYSNGCRTIESVSRISSGIRSSSRTFRLKSCVQMNSLRNQSTAKTPAI